MSAATRRSGPTPVLILGGQENGLSIVRSLARRGVPVHVAAPESCWALRSRYCAGRHPTPPGAERKGHWHELLLEGGAPELEGAVVFPCNDEAIEFTAENRRQLGRRYRLDEQKAELQLALLDKQRTLELARQAGCPVPQHWEVKSADDVRRIEDEIDFPVVIKPIHSHVFQRHFNAKLLVVHDFTELLRRVGEVLACGLEIMLCELVPGPDSLLSSYYTYIDADEQHLFHFTKRIIRRAPVNFGGGCYHVTEWVPETAEMGRRFFRGIGFRGLGNIEFKRDLRDGQLKVIECNARFTAAQELLVRAGIDIAWILYRHLSGGEVPRIERYRERLRLWYPRDDLDAFRELRARGELSFGEWLASVAHAQVFPFWSWRDPVPALARGWQRNRERVTRRLGRP